MASRFDQVQSGSGMVRPPTLTRDGSHIQRQKGGTIHNLLRACYTGEWGCCSGFGLVWLALAVGAAGS